MFLHHTNVGTYRSVFLHLLPHALLNGREWNTQIVSVLSERLPGGVERDAVLYACEFREFSDIYRSIVVIVFSIREIQVPVLCDISFNDFHRLWLDREAHLFSVILSCCFCSDIIQLCIISEAIILKVFQVHASEII